MFGSKYKAIIEQQKAMLAEMEIRVTEQNQLYQAIYQFLSTGMALDKDSKMSDYVREGYEGNPDLFSIVTKLAGMFAQVMDNVKLVQVKGDKEEEIQNDEIDRLFEQANYYQSFYEFCRHWAVSLYITGNGIVYAPRYTAGINKGKLTLDGMIIIPTQNVTIYSKGWRQPIGSYALDMNETYKIDAVDVWHERFAPTLNYENGKNFMGMSPVKVAADIINSQNKGYEITAKMYAYGHPPGILSKEPVEGDNATTTGEQESKFRERYRTKYQGVNNMAIPIFSLGKMSFTKIGYENLKELDVISMSEHGRRIFANILQVPSQLFNDTAASTFNNITEASKAIYTNRLIPDVSQFCAGINRIIRAYGDFQIKPDFSDIETLQEDKAKKAEWISRMFADGIITGDDYLEMMGEERTGLPEMNVRYSNINRVPLDFIINPDNEDIARSDKWYRDHGISDYEIPKFRRDNVNWRQIYEQGGAHWAEDLQPSKLAQCFAEKLVKENKKNILEIGCGNGKDSILFSVAGIDVTAIDIVPEAIQLARRNAERVGVSVNFMEGNAESLTFEDSTFDAVFSLSVLHSTKMNKSIPEIYRVLKSGGIGMIFVYSNVQRINGTKTEFISIDEFVNLLIDNKFIITDLYTDSEEEFDESGEKHMQIITEIKKR